MQTADLDNTISILQQGLNSISSEDALKLVESWKQQIRANISSTTLDEDLERLKLALMGVTDASIAAAIADLGQDTIQFADSLASESADGEVADGELIEKVRQLGALLSQAANSLE
ncbi:MAG: hypothetical protein KME15_14790 [Drouetiella hepatica Uher 2000/2452]|uniref:Uncharacterized protein n=1 Tax=Drouetiella hepatica Uher 2000/2452 TaxID=904376 RepID=A0A951QBW0_9CYAN|nr:hypothetical protein [Drouetiella hepatica Uher 2000/2452]